ncbi:MAG: hypothetical protein WAX85_03055 [Minisyncoccia bacterium]
MGPRTLYKNALELSGLRDPDFSEIMRKLEAKGLMVVEPLVSEGNAKWLSVINPTP